MRVILDRALVLVSAQRPKFSTILRKHVRCLHFSLKLLGIFLSLTLLTIKRNSRQYIVYFSHLSKRQTCDLNLRILVSKIYPQNTMTESFQQLTFATKLFVRDVCSGPVCAPEPAYQKIVMKNLEKTSGKQLHSLCKPKLIEKELRQQLFLRIVW